MSQRTRLYATLGALVLVIAAISGLLWNLAVAEHPNPVVAPLIRILAMVFLGIIVLYHRMLAPANSAPEE